MALEITLTARGRTVLSRSDSAISNNRWSRCAVRPWLFLNLISSLSHNIMVQSDDDTQMCSAWMPVSMWNA